MKKFFKTLVIALLAVGAIALVGCKKDDDNNSNNGNNSGSGVVLSGTSWNCEYDLPYEMQGQTVNVHISATLNFKDASNFSIAVAVPMMQISMDTTGTYTFDGTKGLLTAQGDDLAFTLADANHILVNIPLTEFGGTGVLPLTFTKRR